MAARRPQKASSRREENKRDKVRRIKDAAFTLFTTKGYDDTTTREIAARAGVGLGTVFVYAATKRDLLFLIVNDDLEKILEEATVAVSSKRSALAGLLAIVRIHYAVMRQQPQIWRLALREMYFYAAGGQASRFLATRERLIKLFRDAVGRYPRGSRYPGGKSASVDAGLVGWMAFALFQVEIRRCLMDDRLDVEEAMRQMARQFRLLLSRQA